MRFRFTPLIVSTFLFLTAFTLPGKDADTMWVNLDKGERFLYSSTLEPPGCGRYRMKGYQVVRDGDNRFVFGRENLPGGQYMVAWRICGGVKVLQEAEKVPRKYRNRPIYGRVTIRYDKNVRFYYSLESLDPSNAEGWNSFSGVMAADIVKHRAQVGA